MRRLVSPAEKKEACDDPISFGERAREGVALFNARKYWESHEAWEDVWREGNLTERLFYQGLIQVAAGFVKIQKVWHAPAVLNLEKGLSKLERLKEPRVPIDFERFVREVRAVLEKLKRDGRAKFEKEDWAWWPEIVYLPEPGAKP
ncbi:MAG: DUF309 domain-containing protein [Candidatus Tectomicrobia bacterium]|nr:DUF309 domain-containing protein [Candidatus Tectomicrobia bacterium]